MQLVTIDIVQYYPSMKQTAIFDALWYWAPRLTRWTDKETEFHVNLARTTLECLIVVFKNKYYLQSKVLLWG